MKPLRAHVHYMYPITRFSLFTNERNSAVPTSSHPELPSLRDEVVIRRQSLRATLGVRQAPPSSSVSRLPRREPLEGSGLQGGLLQLARGGEGDAHAVEVGHEDASGAPAGARVVVLRADWQAQGSLHKLRGVASVAPAPERSPHSRGS